MAKNENRTTNDVMTDNELMVCDVKVWMRIQIGNYINKFRTHIDNKDYQTLDELKQEAEDYITNKPLMFTIDREHEMLLEDENKIEQWKNILEDRVAFHGELLTSTLEEHLREELIAEMSTEELNDLFAYNIEFFNEYPIDSLLYFNE